MRPRYLIAALILQSLCWGAVHPRESRNVAGGTAATVFDYPAVVLVVGVVQPARLCTGTLISDTWVLTAAHCVDGLTLEEIAVSHGYPKYHETRSTSQAVMHDDYDPLDKPGGWAHDLALVELDERFLSRTTRTIGMADALAGLLVQPGLSVTIVGWGSADGSPTSMTAATKQLKACPEIPEWAVCTESPLEPTVQGGDSGGPVLMESGGEQILVAVNSWREPGSPSRSRYVRVAEHREWIDSVLAGTAPAPDPCAVDPAEPPVQPPAPPPAPEPFQPQLVEVALGDSGSKVTLMTAPGGGYTLNGRAFAGGEVRAGNGDRYMLALSNGVWTATKVENP